ncbi:MAG: ABC transporter substrate-binding protein [Bacteroidales bacterium]|jgi:oligopeptide transport system substrate-binding protein|nr:ABC transporter substrate-binding protein [Bacteroidales bacterium]
MRVLFQYTSFFVLIFLGLNSCDSYSSQEQCEHCGGNFVVEIPYQPTTLFPPSVDDEVSSNVVNQIHMGLLRFDPASSTIQSGLARTWDIDNTGTKFIFYLDSTVYFHDDPCFAYGNGRQITAHDVKYSLYYLASQRNENKNFALVSRIKGAKDYYLLSETDSQAHISGIKVIDDFIIQIELESPASIFLTHLARPAAAIIPHEAVAKYGKDMTVGAGPFVFQSVQNENTWLLTKNYNFSKQDESQTPLPYLDSVSFQYIEKENETISLFLQNKLDAMLYVANTRIPVIIDSLEEVGVDDYVLYNSTPQSSNLSENYLYNIVSKNIYNLYTNNMHLIDAMIIYKEK